eukprot:m.180455 g.180455  ORF g.180455 m.180455 type:complete len:358 (-) comp18419_c0_seq2:276-1349(-)
MAEAPGAEIDVSSLEAELHAIELTPEEWTKAEVAIPDITETQAFGRSKLKTYYNIHVNGSFYRGYRFSEINALNSSLKKDVPAVAKNFPKFPSKNRLSLGSSTPKQVEDRRAAFQVWFKFVCKQLPLVQTATFKKFVMLKPDIDEIDKDLGEKVADLAQIPEGQWKETQNKKEVKIWTLKMEDSSFLVVRTYVKVKAPLKYVVDTYNTKAAWGNWQPDMKVCKTIEFIEGKTEVELPCKEIIYAAYRVPVLSNRDVCLYSKRFSGVPGNHAEENKATVLSMSIQHPACPHVKGMVRGNLNVSDTRFTAVDGGAATEVLSVLHMDPRGMIPATVVNTMAAHAVDTIVDMRTYMEANCK